MNCSIFSVYFFFTFFFYNEEENLFLSGNMFSGIFWSRVFGTTMERWLPIEIYGMLRATEVYKKTDMYYR